MKQLNMMVDDDVKQAAVDGAKADGMLINKWVSKAIHERRLRQLENQPTQEAIRKSLEHQALTWTPQWENDFLSDEWKYFPKAGYCYGEVRGVAAGHWHAFVRGHRVGGALATQEEAQALVVSVYERELKDEHATSHTEGR